MIARGASIDWNNDVCQRYGPRGQKASNNSAPEKLLLIEWIQRRMRNWQTLELQVNFD